MRRVREDVLAAPATSLLLTGDIAQSGREEEYKTASDWLADAAEATGSPARKIMAVPGNHDVDLRGLKEEHRALQTWMRTAPLDKVEQAMTQILGEDRHPIPRKLADYRSFAFAHDTDFQNWSYPVTTKTFEVNGQSIRFKGLCTAMASDRDDAKNSMFLSASQYRIPRDPEVIDVVFMHHPLTWLRDADRIENYLNSRARILITGHEHQPIIEPCEHHAGYQQLRLAAGAANPPYADDIFRYSYSWLEFDWVNDDDGGVLVVRVYPRTWCEQSTCFKPDDKLVGEDQFVEHRIRCAIAKRNPAARADQPKEADVKGAHSESSESPGSDGSTREGATAPFNNLVQAVSGKALDDLRFFFWRKMQKSERAEILIEVGLLSERARLRLPSAVERQAFEEAIEIGCLHRLWNTVMRRASPSDRLDNPFGENE